jgi:hypothetical protein
LQPPVFQKLSRNGEREREREREKEREGRERREGEINSYGCKCTDTTTLSIVGIINPIISTSEKDILRD